MIAIEKAKELFLKYYRICGDTFQSIESANDFADKFIKSGEDVEYWNEVKTEIQQIEA